jgi:hypothetical protein
MAAQLEKSTGKPNSTLKRIKSAVYPLAPRKDKQAKQRAKK